MKVLSGSQDSSFVWNKSLEQLAWAHKLGEAEFQGIPWVQRTVLSRVIVTLIPQAENEEGSTK